MCGIDPKTLSEILGHSDIKITLDYYFHSSLEFKKKQMELLCRFVESDILRNEVEMMWYVLYDPHNGDDKLRDSIRRHVSEDILDRAFIFYL